MDAADLKVFEAVARLGGMNRAAAELTMSGGGRRAGGGTWRSTPF
jgi:hypothetical protein